jgi:stage II sporulation protein D
MLLRKLSILFFLSFPVLFTWGCSSTGTALKTQFDRSAPLRVLLYTGSDPVRFGSTGDMVIKRKHKGEELYRLDEKTIVMKPESIADTYQISSESGFLVFNDRAYRGTLEVSRVEKNVTVINEVPVESYLLSVVPSEIPAGWEEDALKAQAVAARTYAYHQMARKKGNYHVSAGTTSQVYKGISSEDRRTTRAVSKTRGMIMTFDGKPILALFHSTCGGKTADDSDVWNGGDIFYLKSVKCDYCIGSEHYQWKERIPIRDIETYVRRKYRDIQGIESLSFDKRNDRIVQVRIRHSRGTLTIPGNTFRLLFPPKTLRSLYFDARGAGDSIIFEGRGWGHGVGMCQWGARGLALKGSTWQEILKFYYKGINLERVQDR